MSNCTAEEWYLSGVSGQSSQETLYCLTRGQSIGLTITTEAAFLSVIAVTGLFLLILRNIYLQWRSKSSGTKWGFFEEPTDIYMVSLFLSDLLQATGYLLDVKWINEGKVYTGGFCTAQGIIQQMGETGVAMATLVISLHTFMGLFWSIGIQGRAARLTALGIVACIWVFVILFCGLGAGLHNTTGDLYETPTPYWCWVSGKFMKERIAGEYFWIWAALFVSIIVYVPLYFWSQGRLSVDPAQWWKFRVRKPTNPQEQQARRSQALAMLAYPISYSILVLPLTIGRYIGFGLESEGKAVPSVVTFIVISLFCLSGAVNVVLIVVTRPGLLLFRIRRAPKDDEHEMSGPHSSVRRVRQGVSIDNSAPAAVPGLGALNDDNGWDLPLDRRSVASSYLASDSKAELRT